MTPQKSQNLLLLLQSQTHKPSVQNYSNLLCHITAVVFPLSFIIDLSSLEMNKQKHITRIVTETKKIKRRRKHDEQDVTDPFWNTAENKEHVQGKSPC